jgi:hypothetical protein
MIWNKRTIYVLVIITAKESSSSSSLPPPTPAAAAAIHTYPRAAAAAAAAAVISLEFHPNHVTNKTKAKHIMKISHINENIYGNYGRKVS